MLVNYFPIFLFIIIGLVMGMALPILGFLLGKREPDAEKNSPYECGFEAFEDARLKFDVRYYLIAILFIIFDLEIAFLFPWAVVLKDIGMFGFVAMMNGKGEHSNGSRRLIKRRFCHHLSRCTH